MHLKGERALVYWTLVLTAVLVVVLFSLLLWPMWIGCSAPALAMRSPGARADGLSCVLRR